MILIIAGSRSITHRSIVYGSADSFVEEHGEPKKVIHGNAPGVDRIGEEWAIYRGYKFKRMKAKWRQYGLGAGKIRNEDMAERGTHLLAIWDGHSNGTRHMIDTAKARGLVVKVVIAKADWARYG